MLNRSVQRSGIPLLILAAIVLVAAAGIVVLVGSPYIDDLLGGRGDSDAPEEAADQPPTERPAADQSPPEPAPVQEAPAEQPAPDPERTRPEPATDTGAPGPTGTHIVVRGDTLFDLARTYWADAYLWPVILVTNSVSVMDPDFLRQGSILDIPARPEVARNPGIGAVGDAHIEAYLRYRSLGDETLSKGRGRGDLWLIQLGLIRINKAHWVLYSGLRYDPELLDKAAGTVPDRDLEIVRSFVSRFGARPGM